MNPTNQGRAYRGPSGGVPAYGPRPGHDGRNGNMATPPMTSPPGQQGNFQQPAGMSRAEKFEDEKKRIIESCFSKRDSEGALNESYITHIRVVEDEDYPSSPPPPNSNQAKKKPRVVMVAVRKTGRVRMHKGRENANGTFSIGKSWSLDEMQRVESFTHMKPQNAEQAELKRRAQDNGFIVTLAKPYYWQSATAKEKDFFIFSLIKIYRKYTGGKLPILDGFSPQEMEQLSGPPTESAAQARPANAQPNGIPSARAPSQEAPPRARPPDVRLGGQGEPPRQQPETPRFPPDTPHHPADISRAPDTPRGMRRRPSQDSQSSQSQSQASERPLHSAQQHEFRPLHSASSRDRTLRPGASNERMQLPGSFPSTESVPLQGSQPLRSRRSQSPSSQMTGPTPAAGSSRAPSEQRYASSSFESSQVPQPTASGRSSSEQSRPNGYISTSRFRAPSQQRTDTSDERPRTATKESDVPPPLQMGNVKQRRPSASEQLTSRSDRSNYTQASSMRSPEIANGSLRSGSSQGRYSDRDHSAANPFQRKRSESEVRSTKPPSQDKIDRFPPSKPEERAATATPDPPPIESEPISSFPPPESTPTEEEVHRPGLGPMIKKKPNKEIASKFRKAATAYNAFKPRNAAAEEPKSQAEPGSTGDGITGVFHAPSLLRSTEEARPKTPTIKVDSRPATPDVKKEPPASTVTSPQKPGKPPTQDAGKLQDPASKDAPKPSSLAQPSAKPPLPAQDERRKKRRSDHSAQYAKSLGINPGLLEGRTLEIESVLSDFGWGEEGSRTTFDDLESGIRKELARVEAGSWLGTVESNDDRAATVSDMMDKVMAECEELDCLLTLYNVELGTLSEDVAYIEAQSQGLQVQTANQKVLQRELESLLRTISIESHQLRVLRDASLTKSRNLRDVEGTLAQLYTAMVTIDPNLQHGDRAQLSPEQESLQKANNGYGASGLSSMQAVREKKDLYNSQSLAFIGRFKQYMSVKFKESEALTTDALEQAKQSTLANAQLDDRLRDQPKRGLWMFAPLMLFVREIEPIEWESLMRMYEMSAKKPYQDEFRENIAACKRITRKPIGDDAEVLFTAQEKENESLVGRKLTVKRTKTVRGDGSSRISGSDRPKDGKWAAHEAFFAALSDQVRVISIEQNFVVDFFHVSSLKNEDFVEAISTDPDARRAPDLLQPKPSDPNRSLARKVSTVMEEIFGSWPTEMQAMIDWSLKQDSLNGVGMLFALETQMAQLENTNQDFQLNNLQRLHERLEKLFDRFIKEQVRGIEDTKVKIKKRKGIIAFMKTFPNFCTAIENMLPPNDLPVRRLVNDAYDQINEVMFKSLESIAKESPTAHTTALSAANDAEDKETLNHYILLIENTHHYLDTLPGNTNNNNKTNNPSNAPPPNPVLHSWAQHASTQFSKSLHEYLKAIIRRPLGKLLDFIESNETLLQHLGPSSSPTSIADKPSHSKSIAKKVFSQYDAKELRRGVDTLKKRVEKHFSEVEGGGDVLFGNVWAAAQEMYERVCERATVIVRDVYGGEPQLEWGFAEIAAAFRK